MNIILFYISEYWLYATLMIVTIGVAYHIAKKTKCYETIKQVSIIILVVFLILFGGLGSFVKPHFTNTRSYKFHDKKSGITYWFGGSGAFINQRDVITNDHVVNNCNNIAIRTHDRIYLGKVIAKLKRKKGDIAFIRTNANQKNFALLSHKIPKVNDILIYPNYTSKAGIFDKIKGKVSYVNLKHPFGLRFLSPKGRKGNSGSPIYDQKGYLVGVLHSHSGIFLNHMIAAPLSFLKNFAYEKKIPLYYSNNKESSLIKQRGDFFKEFAVGILCDWKRKPIKLND